MNLIRWPKVEFLTALALFAALGFQAAILGAVIVDNNTLQVNLTVAPAGAQTQIEASLSQQPSAGRRQRSVQLNLPQEATVTLDLKTPAATK